ncbi:MAG: hypothetical protein ACYDD0_04935 [Candidatus Dormibacteria bacterium]
MEDAGAAFIDNYLYVWQQVTPLGAPIHSELLRIDPITGQVLARTLLGGFGLAASDQLLIANGSLWVAAAGPAGAHVARGEVLRFQPETLKATGTTFLTNRGVGQDTAALAGGWVWVTDGGTLYKLSPADGQVEETIPLGTADRSQVTTNARGTVLIVTEAENGFGTIQTRNPTSGALIITTKPGILGVTAPNLSEVTGGGVWVSVATGMQGYLERLDVSTLRPTPLSLAYPGDATNGISAEIMAGALYVQQIAGGPTRNYCGNPATGQMFAALGLGPAATVLAANSSDLFYVPVVSYAGPVARGEELVAMPINAKCRA